MLQKEVACHQNQDVVVKPRSSDTVNRAQMSRDAGAHPSNRFFFLESTMTKPFERCSVNAVSAGHRPLALFCDDRAVGRSAVGPPEDLTPVQYFLISIASGFAYSCRAELSRRKLSKVSFEVVVTSRTEIGSGENPLQHISIVAIYGSGVTETLARHITARAKPSCTVTKMLLDSPAVRFKSRTLRQRDTPCCTD